jgi:dipeptidase E
MRVLLGSGGFRTDERKALLTEEMRRHFGGVRQVLFVPYALGDHDEYLRLLHEKGLDGGYSIDGLHTHADPKAAVRDAEALFVGGGNTFRLLTALYRFDLLDIIKERVHEGLPYLGISAGSNVACPTMQTTNDMPIVMPPSFAALGLVPFQINPHYFSGSTYVKVGDSSYTEHYGETRDDRLREYHELNDTPVMGLAEGGLIRWNGWDGDGCRGTLLGEARVFHKGREPVDWRWGTTFQWTADGLAVLPGQNC